MKTRKPLPLFADGGQCPNGHYWNDEGVTRWRLRKGGRRHPAGTWERDCRKCKQAATKAARAKAKTFDAVIKRGANNLSVTPGICPY